MDLMVEEVEEDEDFSSMFILPDDPPEVISDPGRLDAVNMEIAGDEATSSDDPLDITSDLAFRMHVKKEVKTEDTASASDAGGAVDDSTADPDFIPDDADSEGSFSEAPPSVESARGDDRPSVAGLSALPSAEPVEAETASRETGTHGAGVISTSTVHVSCPVANTANSKRRRVWDRTNVCMFCQRAQAKLSRHLQQIHGTEMEVRMALRYPKGSTERRKAFTKLMKMGNYLHNIAVRSGDKEGALIPCHRARTIKSGDDFLACETCKGFFLRTTLWRHMRRCKPMGGGRVQAKAKAALPSIGGFTTKLRHVIDCMRSDSVSLLCKTDETILLYGENMCTELSMEAKDIQHVRNKMRELGRILQHLRRHSPEAHLKDFLVPGRFSELASGVREVCGFSDTTNKYDTPSLALKLSQSLKRSAALMLTQQIENCEDTSRTRQFLELCERQAEDEREGDGDMKVGKEPFTRKRTEKKRRKMWTEGEKQAIDRHFSSFVNSLQVPGKVDCVRALAAESVLSRRSWTDVKNCVYNRIQKRQKVGH